MSSYAMTFFFVILGLELKAYTLSHSFFCDGFFEIELFAGAGF
jgi:hypothetical protein